MATAATLSTPTATLDLAACGSALSAAERVLQLAKVSVAMKSKAAGRGDAAQHAMHGLAWLATYVEALRQMLGLGQAARRGRSAR